jgi:acyl dehydratase
MLRRNRRMNWENVEVGATGGEHVEGPLAIRDFVRYQGASGDMNPIHFDHEFAMAAGYPKPFAVGMRQAGVMAAYATEWLGAERIRRFKVQFREQAWPGDTISYAGTITGKRIEGDERVVDVELTAIRQSGGVHLKGWATFACGGSADIDARSGR